MSDLIERLRGLSKFEHGDFTIGDEAADRIAELESSFECVLEGGYRKVARLEQEVARLTTHIRAIAKHHDQYSHTTLDWKVVPAWTNYHTARRDFALNVFDV